MQLRHGFLAVAIIGVIGSGCGGGGGNSGGVAGVCDVLADNLDRLFECYPAYEGILGQRPTRAELSTSCAASLQPYIDDGTASIDDNALAACREWVSGRTCDTIIQGGPSPCDDVFVGHVQLGGDCDVDNQCEGDAYCLAGPQTCGVCTARVANGMNCGGANECISRYCDGNGQCAPYTPPPTWTLGDNCAAFSDCGWPISDLYCDLTAGTCANLKNVGDTCGGFLECNLAMGETCDANTMMCIAPTVVGQGQQCSLVAGTVCDTGLVCTSDGMNSVCAPPNQIGDNCTDSCNQLFMECINSHCQYGGHTGMCPAG